MVVGFLTQNLNDESTTYASFLPPLFRDWGAGITVEWLYYCLRDHPQIRVPQHKIEYGYLGSKTFHEKGEPWYFGRFPQMIGEPVNGDVAVDYMLDPTVPEQLPPYTRDPKFIAPPRHPVERMVSAYYGRYDAISCQIVP